VLYRTGIYMVRWFSAHIIYSGRRATQSLCLLLVTAVLVSCASIISKRSDQTINQAPLDINDTTAHAEHLKEIERQVIIEINMMRNDPPEYARRYLVPIRKYYHNKILQFPGEIGISTVEGLRALDECIKELQTNKSLLPLSPKKGLALAARDHAKDQARTGKTGHTGSDGSTVKGRLNRYGRWHISAGENIAYGNKDARRIVTSLLIDDGVLSRGHRRNLLDGTFKFVGVAVGRHRVYRCMCVMVFAGAYNEATGLKIMNHVGQEEQP
jgi:uncharacterized protein YkwD